ncbi:ABC transporter permease [Alloscardovia venturai]|uniref:ABC transporter permease n=1 Tax=Alloscardovia venturai TaxID=1769421 RepID=A0ABW2Y568_9BIFI
MQAMGRHLRTETIAIFAAILSVTIAGYGTSVYLNNASAIWLITARRVGVTSVILAASTAIIFAVGYTHNGLGNEKQTLWNVLRRTVETLALTIVYAISVGLLTAAAQMFIIDLIGRSFTTYQFAIVIFLAVVSGYAVYVQAVMMNSRILATLLPVFIISGVTVAGMLSDDPYWWKNNFSQLGDRTTLGATVFNYTLILGGVTMLIISYFAVSELITQHRLFERHLASEPETREFMIRISVFATLLTAASIMFGAIGVFRYSPHHFLHNFFARGIAVPMTALMVGLPWFVKQFSRVFYAVSDAILVAIATAYLMWFRGYTTLTNVEAIAVMLFMGWFILFSRNIAALEADRFFALNNIPADIVHEVGHSRLDAER